MLIPQCGITFSRVNKQKNDASSCCVCVCVWGYVESHTALLLSWLNNSFKLKQSRERKGPELSDLLVWKAAAAAEQWEAVSFKLRAAEFVFRAQKKKKKKKEVQSVVFVAMRGFHVLKNTRLCYITERMCNVNVPKIKVKTCSTSRQTDNQILTQWTMVGFFFCFTPV